MSNDDTVALVDTPQAEIKPQKDSLKTEKIIIEKVADEQTEIKTNSVEFSLWTSQFYQKKLNQLL